MGKGREGRARAGGEMGRERRKERKKRREGGQVLQFKTS